MEFIPGPRCLLCFVLALQEIEIRLAKEMKCFNKWFQQRSSTVLISYLPLDVTMLNAKGHRVETDEFAKSQLREIGPSCCLIFIIIIICPCFASQLPHSNPQSNPEGPWVLIDHPETSRAGTGELGSNPSSASWSGSYRDLEMVALPFRGKQPASKQPQVWKRILQAKAKGNKEERGERKIVREGGRRREEGKRRAWRSDSS